MARCVSKHHEIQAAYIFGSVAQGRARPDSDIDIAVLLGRRLPDARALRYKLKLAAELGAALHRNDVQLMILNDAPPLLAHRVLSRGALVFERSRAVRVRFHVQTANRYADMVPTMERYVDPADSQSLFDLLARQKVVSKKLSMKLASMAGLRNVLVHEYVEIDRHRVHRALTTDLRDVESFIRAVTRLL